MTLEETEQAGARRADPTDRPSRGRLVAAALALAGLAAVLVLTAVARGPELSLFDEATHADYAYRLSHGQIPAKGDRMAPEILQEWSCHGSWDRKPLPPCGVPNPPERYAAGGENYNSMHPPTYYLLTGLAARAIDAVLPASFVTSARLVGLAWLLAGMAVLYLALRRLGATRPYAALGVAALPLIPTVLHASSTVSNDAPAVLAGALALLVLARVVVEERTGLLVPAAATALVTSTKVLNALPLLVVAALFALRAVLQWRRGERLAARRLVLLAGAIVVAFLVVYQGWSLFQAGRGPADWVNPIRNLSGRPVHGLPFDELLSTSFTGFPLTSQFYLQPDINGSWVAVWNRLLTALVVASPFVVLALSKPWSPAWTVGAGTLAGMLLYPLAVEVQVYLWSQLYFPSVLVRYGMTLIPWALAGLVLVASTRKALRTSVALTAGGAALMLATVTGLL
jgi:hypothetical protein